jgi:hypothetical protein
MTAVPGTFLAGAVLAAASMEAIMKRPLIMVGRNTAQSITTSTVTVVGWNTEGSDDDAMHDNVTNNSRLTIPASCGGWWIWAVCIPWAANATGAREVGLRVNGGSGIAIDRNSPGAAVGHYNQGIGIFPTALNAGDYVEAQVWQSSGGSLNIDNTAFQGAWMAGFWLRRA